MHLLVSEQYIDSLMNGLTIKEFNCVWKDIDLIIVMSTTHRMTFIKILLLRTAKKMECFENGPSVSIHQQSDLLYNYM